MKKKIIIIVAIVITFTTLLFAGLYFNQPNFLFNKVETSNSGKTITYKGRNGKTALELLLEKTKTQMTGNGKNAFVTGINGVIANPSTQYWALYVNDKAANVGAGSLVTKDGEIITWKLTNF